MKTGGHRSNENEQGARVCGSYSSEQRHRLRQAVRLWTESLSMTLFPTFVLKAFKSTPPAQYSLSEDLDRNKQHSLGHLYLAALPASDNLLVQKRISIFYHSIPHCSSYVPFFT